MGASMAGFVFAKLFAFLTIPPSFILGSKILSLQNYGDKFMTAEEKLKPLGEIWNVVKDLFSSGELIKALAGWTVGASVFGLVLGTVGFFITRTALRKYQAKRQARREQVLAEKTAVKI